MSNARNLAKVITGNFDIPAGSLNNAIPADGSITEVKLASGAVTTTKLASGAVTVTKIDTPARVAAGTLAFFVVNSTPSGWIKCNGATVSRTTYADLFAAIGTSYGVGDGSTTFGLPDCRGEFPRFFDDGRGIDNGRGIGSWQKGSVNAFNIPYDEGLGGMMAAGNAGDQSLANAQAILGYDPAHANGYNTSISIHVSTGPARDNDWYMADGWGGGVTRPRNLAFLACIKY